MTGIRSTFAGLALLAGLSAGALAADDNSFTLATPQARLDVPVATKPAMVAIMNMKLNQPMLAVRVEPALSERLCTMTRQGVGGPLRLYIGCDLIWTVAIGSPVCESMFNITGGFSRAQIDDFMRRMQRGSPSCAELKH